MSYGFKIIVEGDYACFTRPEMKVERVSYEWPTPGALEGMLKSIYWKPAIRYVIDKIIVFNKIQFDNIRRNEVKEKISFSNITKQMKSGKEQAVLYTKDVISQRASMVLKDVKYGIQFHFELTGLKSSHEGEGEEKHYNIIKRRLEKGQYFRSPCLGCAEFPARNIHIVEDFDLEAICQENLSLEEADYGYMLYGLKFEDQGRPINNDWQHPEFSDKAVAEYYRPKMIRGIIDVAKYREGRMC